MYTHFLLIVMVALVTELPIIWAQANTDKIRDHCEKEHLFVYHEESGLCLRWALIETFYFRALDTCEDFGGRLGVFDTEEKFKVLQARKDGSLWVGMDNRTGTFRWLNGKPLDMKMASEKFIPTRPTTAGIPLFYDCVHIFHEDHLLKNSGCNSQLHYVCEKPL